MTRIILVEKTGILKQLNAKDLTDEVLYKRCGFKKSEDFERRAAWPIGGNVTGAVELWAKNTGRAGAENKYELPHPIDKTLFFGTMAIIARDQDGEHIDLDIDTWEKMYEKLFGGFEDLGNSDSDEDDELDNIPNHKKTKEGYLKDGFVVDNKQNKKDEEDIINEDDDEYSNDNEEEFDDEDNEYSDSNEDEEEFDDDNDDENEESSYDGSELQPEEYYYTSDDE